MFTNLFAAVVVTLITNTVENPLEFVPRDGTNPYGGQLIKKEVVTTVTEVRRIHFKENGDMHENISQKVVSTERKLFTLEWRQVHEPPPLPNQTNYIWHK